MAKLAATEGAQQVIDAAVQMFGGLGVRAAAGRAAVPRDPRAAHLRRRDRSAAADHRARTAEGDEGMNTTGSAPGGWPRPKGYANGVVAQGRMLFIAGMIGWDAQGASTATISRRRPAGAAECRRRAAGGGRKARISSAGRGT
jgi:hypothetical protein